MESLSRPFHSRKLSSATTFSPKNAHDGVFSGHRHNYPGASPIDVQDYREVFGSSPAASSIPVLDFSTLREPSDALNLKLNFRSSKPDYSKIFGRFRDEDVAVSYEELFVRDKPRSPSSKTSSSPDSDNLSHQSSDYMSYNKISQKSKGGLDATRHVAQLHAIPGFTRFIDEAVPPLMEATKHTADKNFKTFDNLSTVSSPSASPTTVNNRKDYSKRSTAISCDSSGTFSPSYFDGEVDVNSAASTSAAALKKAIEKAQESIRIAKESVGRKKKGLRSFSSKSLKDSLKVASEEHEVRQVFERATSSSQGFLDMGRSRKYFMDSEKLFGVKKVIDEINCKISESTKEPKENKDEVGPSLPVSQKMEEDEMKVPEESNQYEKRESHKKEETGDYSLHGKTESAQNCDSSSEESEVILEDDDRGEEKWESLDQELNENLSFDTNVSEENDSADDTNDNNVGTTQESDTDFAQIGTEENDFQSESSFETEEEEEDSNIQLSEEEIPKTESTNEIHERIDEVAGEENKERIDDMAAREREKERLVVDRAIREARERARERVERAAVEKVTEEIKQRMMAEARERAERAATEKATEEIRQRMRADKLEKALKASAQSKLRAERAAVERATSEARQRALEKAMTKKPLQDSRTSEKALRSKAKLEKDNRILERAAKALAEKEKRDLLAQKEQAERNRLAENLDADIKKWSSGKEGNLRALLSTLQYILGPESGWQQVALSEIVATSAVKKAYRKATLCVHPDKLQQRGASIQQKYICEKVFDLLKAASSKFNSEER